MKIVIIEDEQLAADDLTACIRDLRPSYEIIAVLSSVRQALSFFETKPSGIDLLFSDIQLGDGMSFDIFSRSEIRIPVIFCTAFDEYAMNAFRANGIDYVLKPFSKESIRTALEKFENLRKPAEPSSLAELIGMIRQNEPVSRSVLVHYRDKIIPVPAEEIAVLFVQDEHGTLLTVSGVKYPFHQPLDQLSDNLGSGFYRANRSFLVNRKVVRAASRYFGRKLLVELNIPFEEQILVSKEKSQHFLDWLAGS